jgi:hypothetical protein
MSDSLSTTSEAVLEPQLTLESFPRPSLTDEQTPLLPPHPPRYPSPSPPISPLCSTCSTFTRNFMLTTLLATILYITSFMLTFFLTNTTFLILAYTIQGCSTMWCMIVWFLHHVWLVEKPVKFMAPLHLSAHYYEILRFECLLERYVDVRNIAIAGGLACLEIAFACGNVFAMVVRAYIGFARDEAYGWFGEYKVDGDANVSEFVGVVISSVGWIVVLVWFVVTVKVICGLSMQIVDIGRMVRRRREEEQAKV